MADASYYVDAPRRSPRRGGIRTVAEFRTAEDRLGMGGVVEYTSPGCQIAVGEVALCYPSPADAQDPKLRDGIHTLEGIAPVAGIYAGVECFLGGSDFEADALRLLEGGSDRAIEKGLQTFLATQTPVEIGGVNNAILFAETDADRNYVGLPVIVMNRGDAGYALAQRFIEGDGTGNLWTGNGTPVLATSQMPSNSLAVLGGLTVLLTNPTVNRVQNYTLNTEYAIAEQVFAILVDCNYVKTYSADGGGGVIV